MKLFRPAGAVLGAAASAAVLALSPGLPAQAALTTSWHVVFRSHYGAATNYSGYTAVTAAGATGAWAFGSTNIAGAPAPGTPVAERWTGTSWQSSPLPSGLTSEIASASAISPGGVWAVTEVGGDILHWNGTRWSVAGHVTGPSGAIFTDVIAFRASDVWAFGASVAAAGLGAWHYDGTTWTHVTGQASRVGIGSALSATDIWGIGSTVSGPEGNQIVHYNGSAWQPVTATALKNLEFGDILALSDTDVWAAATVSGNTTKQRLLRLSKGVWSVVKLPWQVGSLRWLAPDGRGGMWLDASTGSQTWIVHRSAAGRWSRTQTPGLMGPMALIPGTTSLWGVGRSSATGGTGSDAEIWAHGSAAGSPSQRLPALCGRAAGGEHWRGRCAAEQLERAQRHKPGSE